MDSNAWQFKFLRLSLVVGLVLAGIFLLSILLAGSAHAAPLEDSPHPFPRDCTGVNPSGYTAPACCVYGYVYYDGAPVSGATVTVRGPDGSKAVTTSVGEFSDDPYFAAPLSESPIGASVGDTITLSVSYSGRERTFIYVVVGNGQQVDLVLPTNTSDTPIYYVSGSESNRQIWRMNGDGTGRTQVRNGFDPDICPVNGRVLFVDGGDVHVMELDGAYVANLTAESTGPGSYPAYNPDWSPDCSQIVYAAAYPGWQYTLIKMNADGSGKQVLLAPPEGENYWYPEWSPNGQWIAFTANPSGFPDGKIYRANADGSNVRDLTEGWFPVWSPDSSRIAYVGYDDGPQDIWVMNSDGSEQRRVGNAPSAWWPYWISDSRLMYVSDGNVLNGTDLNIFTINADGTDKIRLTDDAYYRSPTVRPTYLPVATIHSVAPNPALQGRDTVTFRGSGQEADENSNAVIAYQWRSSLDGVLSAQATFTMAASGLSTGTHMIYFQVQDDEGDWSPEAWRLLVVTDEPFDIDVLIVTNQERLAALYGEGQADGVLQKLDELALTTNGMVLQVEQDPLTAAAYNAWLANPGSFTHANAVADAIHSLIVAQLGMSPDLAYVVIVGDDRVVPFRRVRDQTHHPEHHYHQVPPDTTTGAALAADRTLTDDFYGDRVPTIPDDPDWDGHPLYIPDMAIGRLIETPDEIIAQVDWFLDYGEIQAEEAIVTGYDFLVDSAQEMCSALVADGLFPDCGLIGDSWNATQFLNQVLNQRHALVSFNGHADHYMINTPSGAVSSDHVQNSSGNHSGALFWTPGCHGALNVPPQTDVALDTVQALVGRRALVVGNTGYGWGYRLSVGLSEQLMLNYTRRLLEGGQATAGQALVAAKQQYYLEELDFDYYDEKILIEATFYGIPMTQVTLPNARQSATAVKALRRSTLESTNTLTVEHVLYDFPALIAETTSQGTFYSCGGQAEHSNGAPIQPRYTDPVLNEVGKPHGVVLREAQGEALPNIDPVVDEAIWDVGNSGDEPAFDEPIWFPDTLLSLNQVGGQSELAIGLGQFHGLSQTQWLYGAMAVDIYASTVDDWDGPQLQRIESGQQGSSVTVTVTAQDASGIHAVVVAYADGDGNWSSSDLVWDNGLWRGDFQGNAGTVFFVQVVDGAGNVTMYTRGGRYMRPGDTYYPSSVFLPLVVQGK